MENKTTILLLLKDRPEFTKRWLHVHEMLNFQIPIHIADGSLAKKNEKIISEFLKRNKRLKIDYKHYGKDIDLPTFYRKITNAIKSINSQYVIFTCNDDFLIEKSIIEGADFLENNKGYVATAGPVYDTTMCQTKLEHTQIWGKLSHPINQYPAFDRKEELAESRIYNFLAGRKNSYIFMALHRRDALLKTNEIIEQSCPPDLRLQEHLLSMMTLCFGKVSGAMPCMTFHQNNPGESAGKDIIKKGTWYQWIQSKEWFEFYKKMISVLVENISESEYSTTDLKRRIEIYYQAQIGQMNIREFHPSYKSELFAKGDPMPTHGDLFNQLRNIRNIVENK